MSKHTVGPWHYSPKLTASENHRGWGIYVKGKWIADVSPMSNSEGDPSDEGEANVALISAAPDLLNALLLCRDFWTAKTPIEVRNVVRAALAKAEGK